MPDTIRQRIIDNLATRLGTILVAGGYQTNAGQRVFVWKPIAEVVENCPCINIDDPACVITTSGRQHKHALTVEIKCYAAQGATTDKEVRKMIADVCLCLRDYRACGGLATDISLDGDEMLIIKEAKTLGGAKVKVTIHFFTRVFDPYNQQ